MQNVTGQYNCITNAQNNLTGAWGRGKGADLSNFVNGAYKTEGKRHCT